MATSSNVESVSMRLKKLEDIEKKITLAIKTAGKYLMVQQALPVIVCILSVFV